jgi:hypothetical protein
MQQLSEVALGGRYTMIRYEFRDAAIALGLPAAAAAGILAVSHHALPWQHEAQESSSAAAAHSSGDAEDASLNLPPVLNGLLSPQEAPADHGGADTAAGFVFFGGAILTWAGTSFLPRNKEKLQPDSVISPTAIPRQLGSVQIETANVAAPSVYETA